jgi:hypothetical protein
MDSLISMKSGGVYKAHVKDTHPDVYALIEKDEPLVRKIFLSSIDMLLAVPAFLIHAGISRGMAAMTMFTLEKSMKKEYREILKAEGK